MKGKIIRTTYGSEVPEPKECLILGVTGSAYYVLDETNRVNIIKKEWVDITDHEQPDFWINDNGMLIPEEWRLENYMLLYDCDLLEEWDEIWITTQFAKGLARFNLQSVPLNYKDAFDNEYKLKLVGIYLKFASDYDNLLERSVCWYYRFQTFDFDTDFFGWSNGEPQYFSKKLLSGNQVGFDVLQSVLKQIGSGFETSVLQFDFEQLDIIRNRILFSIWALFSTKEFEVYHLEYKSYGRGDFVLKLGDQCYLLSLNYTT